MNDIREFIQNEVLTTAEVADLLSISKAQISRLVDKKVLQPAKISPQGMLFLKADIVSYKYCLNKMDLRLSHKEPLYFIKDMNTRNCVKLFKEHRCEMGKIDSIYIYFNDLDAIINNYYDMSELGYGNLRYIRNPLFVIRDNENNEIWIAGCNCGYGGSGPHGSAAILAFLREEGTLPEDQFSDEAIERLIWNRLITIKRNIDNTWEVVAGNSQFGDIMGGASVYYHNNELVLIQDVDDYRNESPISVISTYQAFIPEPKKIVIYPSNEKAEERGYFLYKESSYFNKIIYNVIIMDASGRQVWLQEYFTNNRNPVETQSMKDILVACGFPADENDLMKNISDSNFLHRIKKWYEIYFNVNEPIVIENK